MSDKVLIIAEAGVNHNGSVETACKLCDAAKEAGADIVKFQTSKPDKIVSKFAQKAKYQQETTGKGESQLDMIKKISLSYDSYRIIKKHCDDIGMKFLSTPFECESVDFLKELGCNIWKIPSGEVTDLPQLEKIASMHEPVILSTGMCTLDEIRECVNVLKKNGAGEITLLHCTTQYPAPFEEINLNAMETLRKEFGCKVGYSDHSLGIEVPIAAVAMGATVIEKHFTLDKNMVGPDHRASLEPSELKAMVSAIRNIEKAKGSSEKTPTVSEAPNRLIARKSIVAARAIKKGEILTEENITMKRPGSGISPMKWREVAGTCAKRDFEEDELIEL